MRHCSFLRSLVLTTLCISATLGRTITRRDPHPEEHVILADCTTSMGAKLSQMAYWGNDTIASTPDSVVVVDTAKQKTADWLSGNITAQFPDGVPFTANITSSTVEQGAFAGMGSNGYAGFTCWVNRTTSLYQWYGGVTCDGLYDCSHKSAPENTNVTKVAMPSSKATTSATPSTTTTLMTTAATTAAPAAPTGTGSAMPQNNNMNGQSDNIALGIGLGLGLPSFIVAIIGVWYASRQSDFLQYLKRTDSIPLEKLSSHESHVERR